MRRPKRLSFFYFLDSFDFIRIDYSLVSKNAAGSLDLRRAKCTILMKCIIGFDHATLKSFSYIEL